jgi:DNA-binding transcriptional ArsR family regulator
MTTSDASFYEVKARTIAVLANPKRLEIIDLLGEKERTVSELAEALGLAQATTSQHLAVMRKAGVVETSRDGNFVRYRLADPKIASACGVMSQAVLDLLVKQHKRLQPILAIANRQR